MKEMPMQSDEQAKENFIQRETQEIMKKEGVDEAAAREAAEREWDIRNQKNLEGYVRSEETGEVMKKETQKAIEEEMKRTGASKEKMPGLDE